MNLTDASLLLGENSRYFSEVYKNFSFKDEQTLKDYLDFIVHEPVEWLKGFPAKLKTKNTFSRPKTILVKLLKTDEIVKMYGQEYINTVYNSVWNAFKKNVDTILAQRNKKHVANVVEQMNEEVEANSIHTENIGDDAEVVEDEGAGLAAGPGPEPAPASASGPGPGPAPALAGNNHCACPVCLKWEYKVNVCMSALNSLLQDYSYTAPGLANTTSILLQTLRNL